jgi:hypothetical protein
MLVMTSGFIYLMYYDSKKGLAFCYLAMDRPTNKGKIPMDVNVPPTPLRTGDGASGVLAVFDIQVGEVHVPRDRGFLSDEQGAIVKHEAPARAVEAAGISAHQLKHIVPAHEGITSSRPFKVPEAAKHAPTVPAPPPLVSSPPQLDFASHFLEETNVVLPYHL